MMRPILSNGGTDAIEALDPSFTLSFPHGLWRSNADFSCFTRDEDSTISTTNSTRERERRGRGQTKVYRKRGAGNGKLTHLRFSQDVLLLRNLFL